MNKSSKKAQKNGNRFPGFFIVQAWLVLLLASFFGAALAGIQLTLAPKIEANKLNETLEKVPELILGADAARALAESGQAMTIDRQYVTAGSKTYSVFKAGMDNQIAGWVIKAAGQGYADKVELLVGTDTTISTITGLFILDQKETPGLGNKIIEPAWRGQFSGKPIAKPLTAVKTGADADDEINAITGATISSKAVCNIINQSLKNLKQPLADALKNPTSADNQQEKN